MNRLLVRAGFDKALRKPAAVREKVLVLADETNLGTGFFRSYSFHTLHRGATTPPHTQDPSRLQQELTVLCLSF
jgi:hypothetical protein